MKEERQPQAVELIRYVRVQEGQEATHVIHTGHLVEREREREERDRQTDRQTEPMREKGEHNISVDTGCATEQSVSMQYK